MCDGTGWLTNPWYIEATRRCPGCDKCSCCDGDVEQADGVEVLTQDFDLGENGAG